MINLMCVKIFMYCRYDKIVYTTLEELAAYCGSRVILYFMISCHIACSVFLFVVSDNYVKYFEYILCVFRKLILI